MDADLSHPPEQIPPMLDKMMKEKCDLVIGSRYVHDGAIKDWSIWRKITSNVSKFIVYPLTRVKDPLAGYFIVRRHVIKNTLLNPIGFKILLEILTKGQYETVIEVPIIFQDRVSGSSKLSKGVAFEYLLQVASLYFGKSMSFLKKT